MFRTLKDGPCSCTCHDQEGVMHIMSCCAYTYQPRAEAEAKARVVREEEMKRKLTNLSPHEIHDMVTNDTLFEKFPLPEGEDKPDLPAKGILFKDIVSYTPGGVSSKKE